MKASAFFAVAIIAFLAGCESSRVERSEFAATRSATFAEPPRDRPGLGTRWGETRNSVVHATEFERANFNHPFALAAIYYNDEAGIRAMVGAVELLRREPVLPEPASSFVTVELRDESGRLLPGLVVGDQWFVIGEEGRRYSILVRNHSDLRLETVLSVDGLDVIDGRPASFRKRGYILRPHSKLVVEGFRQSTNAVAAFRFSPVRESYASEKYHNTQNVGVVGIALFNEHGSYALTAPETERRLKANPFPGRFATPP